MREYWRKQFKTVQPHLRVLGFREDERGRAVFTIHKTVRDLQDKVLAEQDVQHRFSFQNKRISLFEIVSAIEVMKENDA